MNEEGARRLHHKTLSAYYPHLFNLRDLITSLLPPSTVIALPTDPEGYHKLLSDTICAFQTPPGLPKVYTVACQGTQQDAVARIAQALEGRGKNVLSFRERVSCHARFAPNSYCQTVCRDSCQPRWRMGVPVNCSVSPIIPMANLTLQVRRPYTLNKI